MVDRKVCGLWSPGGLGLHSTSTVLQLCGLGQVASPALFPPPVHWQSEFLPHRLAGINQEESVLSNYLARAQPPVGASISMVLLSS